MLGRIWIMYQEPAPYLQVLRGNPLVQQAPDEEVNFGMKRRWDDDVVFKNQDRGAPKKQQRFINDTIRCAASAQRPSSRLIARHVLYC